MSYIIFNGLMMGCIYALVAFGFVLIYNTVGVINFAQGDLVACGAYLALLGMNSLHLNVIASIPVIICGAVLLGYLFSKCIYAPLRKRSTLTVVITTFGASIVIANTIQTIAGPDPVSVNPFFAKPVLRIGAFAVPTQALLIYATTAAAFLILYIFFFKTAAGIRMRAMANDQYAAALCGINTKRLITSVFIISISASALAGLLILPVTLASPNMGFDIIAKALVGAVIGGFGSLPGAIIGGLIVGLAEPLFAFYISSAYASTLTMLLLVVILLVRPQGLFGEAVQEKV